MKEIDWVHENIAEIIAGVYLKIQKDKPFAMHKYCLDGADDVLAIKVKGEPLKEVIKQKLES